MEKKDFHQDHKYVVTVKDSNGTLRPANFYVLKLHGENMIVRMADKDGLLRKIKYDTVEKIVSTKAIDKQNRLTVPEAMLTEKHWKDRTVIEHYSSSPHAGK